MTFYRTDGRRGIDRVWSFSFYYYYYFLGEVDFSETPRLLFRIAREKHVCSYVCTRRTDYFTVEPPGRRINWPPNRRNTETSATRGLWPNNYCCRALVFSREPERAWVRDTRVFRSISIDLVANGSVGELKPRITERHEIGCRKFY